MTLYAGNIVGVGGKHLTLQTAQAEGADGRGAVGGQIVEHSQRHLGLAGHGKGYAALIERCAGQGGGYVVEGGKFLAKGGHQQAVIAVVGCLAHGAQAVGAGGQGDGLIDTLVSAYGAVSVPRGGEGEVAVLGCVNIHSRILAGQQVALPCGGGGAGLQLTAFAYGLAGVAEGCPAVGEVLVGDVGFLAYG